jgi:hypothetical protein
VKTHHQRLALALLPQRIIHRMVPAATVIDIGTEEDRLELVFLADASSLSDRGLNVRSGHHRCPEKPSRIGPAQIMKPVVVGTADRSEQPVVKPGDRHDEQAAARIKNRKIQTLPVHGAENADPIIVASLCLGVVLVLETAGVVPALASDALGCVPDDLPLHHYPKPASDIG